MEEHQPTDFLETLCSPHLVVPQENLSRHQMAAEGADAEMHIEAFGKCFQVHLEMLLIQDFRPKKKKKRKKERKPTKKKKKTCRIVILWDHFARCLASTERSFLSEVRQPFPSTSAIFGTGHRCNDKKMAFVTLHLLPYQRLAPSRTGTIALLPNGGLNPSPPSSRGNPHSADGWGWSTAHSPTSLAQH